MVMACIIISSFPKDVIPKDKVEKMARDMGMKYPDEIKAFFQNDEKGGVKK